MSALPEFEITAVRKAELAYHCALRAVDQSPKDFAFDAGARTAMTMSRTSQPSIKTVRYIEPKSFSDPEKAARKLIEIANAAEAVQDGRIHVELINLPFLRAGGGSPD